MVNPYTDLLFASSLLHTGSAHASGQKKGYVELPQEIARDGLR